MAISGKIEIAVDLEITCNMSWNLRKNLHNQQTDTNECYIFRTSTGCTHNTTMIYEESNRPSTRVEKWSSGDYILVELRLQLKKITRIFADTYIRICIIQTSQHFRMQSTREIQLQSHWAFRTQFHKLMTLAKIPEYRPISGLSPYSVDFQWQINNSSLHSVYLVRTQFIARHNILYPSLYFLGSHLVADSHVWKMFIKIICVLPLLAVLSICNTALRFVEELIPSCFLPLLNKRIL